MSGTDVYMVKLNGFIHQNCYTSLKAACEYLGVNYSTAVKASNKTDFIIFFAAKNGTTKEIYKLKINKVKGRGNGNRFIKIK